jgi:hypothetical protein
MQKEHKIVATFHPDGAALLDITSGTMSTLNATGAYIWEALQAGESSQAIAANLARETGQETQSVEADVESFVSALEASNLFPRRETL